MLKTEAITIAEQAGAGYLAHIITCDHRHSARKLIGLANLINAGHTVNLIPFSLDQIQIDGINASWTVLEEWTNRS